MLVLAADLEEVEEVCCSGMNGDEVFVRLSYRVGNVSDGQVTGTLSVWSVTCTVRVILSSFILT